MGTTTETPERDGPCVLTTCHERPTGYVVGAEPPILVCPSHVGPVERASLHYRVAPFPDRERGADERPH